MIYEVTSHEEIQGHHTYLLTHAALRATWETLRGFVNFLNDRQAKTGFFWHNSFTVFSETKGVASTDFKK
jgi:hypothetical protein